MPVPASWPTAGNDRKVLEDLWLIPRHLEYDQRVHTCGYRRAPAGLGLMSDVTQIISRIEAGDRAAADELLPLVYQELRRLAEARLAHEKSGQTLQATALVHEAYLRLVDRTDPQDWDNSRHFFSAAAEAMRRILIERARQRASLKRGGNRERIAIDAIEPAVLPLRCDDLLGLEAAVILSPGV